MFLVSIGVPLDLDEILPRSTQKKLVLPSFDHPGRSPRPSTDGRGRPGEGAANVAQMKLKNRNDSNSSLASTESGTQRKRERRMAAAPRGPPPPPEFDASAATVLGNTTREALAGMSDAELKAHVERLYDVCRLGTDLLKYWEERREEAGREKEAFEGVIENLVKHARSVRK